MLHVCIELLYEMIHSWVLAFGEKHKKVGMRKSNCFVPGRSWLSCYWLFSVWFMLLFFLYIAFWFLQST